MIFSPVRSLPTFSANPSPPAARNRYFLTISPNPTADAKAATVVAVVVIDGAAVLTTVSTYGIWTGTL